MRLTRLIILSVCTILVLIVIASRRRLRNSLHRFWSTPGSPVTLAVFRIVLFGTLFLSVDLTATVWYSRMPAELRIGFFALHRILPQLVITPAPAGLSAMLLLVFSALAMIGFLTRTSAWLTVVFGLYVLGTPPLFGKVNHLHHHLIWFAALMAVSHARMRCLAMRFAKLGGGQMRVIRRPLPIPENTHCRCAFVWLLVVVIYFFPGFWKLWNVGPSWALSDNMRAQMHFKWIEFDGWTPALRIDHYPAFCALVGIATIAFETTFLFLVFSGRLRPWLIVAGLAFHNLTNLFMRVSFAPLQAMYASLVDCGPAFQRLGHRLYPAQLSVAYDGRCPISRRIIASLRVFDIFGRVTYTDSGHELASLDPQRRITVRMEQSNGTKGGHLLTDLSAWRALAARLPIFWPALPFFFLIPEQNAHFLSQRLARLCDDQARRQSPLRVCAVTSVRSASSISAAAVLGTVLLLVNVAFGVRRVSDAWPFACYPAFDFRASEQCYALTVALQRKDGQIIELNRSGLSPNFAPDRARGLQEALLAIQDPQDRRLHFRALWGVMAAESSRAWQHSCSLVLP